MSQFEINPEQVGGEFMIQDRDHMSDAGQHTSKAKRGQQSEQSQGETRQHGGAKKGDNRPRQAH